VSVRDNVEADIDLGGLRVSGGKQMLLTHGDIHAHNTFEHPKEVVSLSSPIQVSGSRFRRMFPPASVNVLELDLK
jgi:alpha-L-arabinofuranosidase